jgi:hypothetical protein
MDASKAAALDAAMVDAVKPCSHHMVAALDAT